MQENKTRKPGSGGSRLGAGRPTAENKPYTIRVTEQEKQLIERVRKHPILHDFLRDNKITT